MNEVLARFGDQGAQHSRQRNSTYKSVERVCDIRGKSMQFDGKIKLERRAGAGEEKLPDSKYISAYPDHLFKTVTALLLDFSITRLSCMLCTYILPTVYGRISPLLGCKLLEGRGLFLCPSVYP